MSALPRKRTLIGAILISALCQKQTFVQVQVANQLTNPGTVSVINTSTNKVVATITTGAAPIGPPTGVAVTPDGKHVYVTNESTPTGTVAVIKAPTNKVVATIPVGDAPVGLAFTPDGKRAFVANFNSNNVSVIDTSTKKVVATIGVGTHPSGVGIVMTRRAARRRVPRHK